MNWRYGGGGLGSQTRLSQANHVRGGPLEIPGGRDITQKNLAKEECPKKILASRRLSKKKILQTRPVAWVN